MDGLTRALEAIQKKSEDLYAFEVEGVEVIFRLPSIKQASQYALLLDMAPKVSLKSAIYDSIFEQIVENEWQTEKNFNQLPAGISETTARLALFLSGVDVDSQDYTEELYKTYRKQLNVTADYMKRVICIVFAGYTFESLDSLNYQQLVYNFIQAEKVLLDRGIIEEEHAFQKPEDEVEKPYLVEDVLRQDTEAYQEFDRPADEDPEGRARMQKIREEAIQRARQQELEFKRKMYRRGR
jgi:hypothetical protein